MGGNSSKTNGVAGSSSYQTTLTNDKRLEAFNILYRKRDWIGVSGSAWELSLCLFDDYCYAVNRNIHKVGNQADDIRLIAITCLMVASKYHDEPYWFDVRRASLTLSGISKEEILNMELEVLKTLDYGLFNYRPCCYWIKPRCRPHQSTSNRRYLRRLLINLAYCQADLKRYYNEQAATLVMVASRLVYRKRIKRRHWQLASRLATEVNNFCYEISDNKEDNKKNNKKDNEDVDINSNSRLDFLTDYYDHICDTVCLQTFLQHLQRKKLIPVITI